MKYMINLLKKYTLLSFLLFLSTLLWGQKVDNLKYLTVKEPTKIIKKHEKMDLSSLKIKPEAKALLKKMAQQQKVVQSPLKDELGGIFENESVPFQTFLKRNKQQKDLLISRDKQNVQLSTIPDKQGNTHIKLQQYWNGLPIWNSQVIVHANSKGVYAFNGRYHASPGLAAAAATITKKEAAKIVAKVVGKEKFKVPAELKELLPNTKENLPELLYYFDEQNNQMKLAWKVEFHTQDHKDWLFMIDAQNEEILKKVNQACHLDAAPPSTARATDLHGVTQTINTFFDSENSLYLLADFSRPMFNPETGTGVIITRDLRFSDSLRNSIIPGSRTNTWTNPAAVSAHHHAGICYDYYFKTHNRNSINGNGGNIISYFNRNLPDNASWSPSLQAMFYGFGNNRFKQGSTAKSLDISGHEMTHGVVSNSANFDREGQPGSLNESFADIFGMMIDRDDWTLGEDIVNREVFPSGNLRNIANPSNNQAKDQPNWQPSHMRDYNEEGGIHLNDGIPNYAFYLFATTQGVGKNRAEQVYYKALTQYLMPESQFIDARKAVIMSAKELYGASAERAATAAFDAVGKGQPVMAEINLNDGSYYVKSNINFVPRVSVAGTGDAAIFIGTDDQVYIMDLKDNDPLTNSTQFFTNPGGNIEWRKVAVSKDLTKIAALTGDFEASILFYDLTTDTFKEFEINHTDGEVDYLDMIQFDHTGQYIIYDAYNERSSGNKYWDMGIINVWNNSTRRLGSGKIRKPFSNLSDGYSHGNPIFSNTSNSLIAFEQIAENQGSTEVYVYDIRTYEYAWITTNEFYSDYSLLAAPCFAPNDDYLAYVTDKGSDNNYVTFQKFDKNTVATVGESQARFTGEYPMWYTFEANKFNGEDGQIASARVAHEATSLLTLPLFQILFIQQQHYNMN